ncbi:hypothetical protein BB560_003221 [Smittium megazygosporum]|uniref:DUF676 domain-containing protein n=1 Tax=Smittium megazygosporum TaxID=133381 RepID=A0A2T9ZCL0_9FUNG|nr:hypothetical protein BB560_003221 [Smittium megazygosporum]
MAAALMTRAQNLLNLDSDELLLERISGSMSVGDVCRYQLYVSVPLEYKEFHFLYKDLFNNKTDFMVFDRRVNGSKKGWDLASVPENLIISVNNTSPIRKNLSLLKQEGPHALSVLVKPELPSLLGPDFYYSKNHPTILCGSSWSTKVPLRELVIQELEDLLDNHKSSRLSIDPENNIVLEFNYIIDAVSEVILPPAAVSFEIDIKAVVHNQSSPIHASITLELVSDTASIFKLPDPSIFIDEAETGVHLFVLSHGLHGSRNEMIYLTEQLKLKSSTKRKFLGADGNRRLVVLSHDVNHGNTTDGVEAGGKRIANKILEYVSWLKLADTHHPKPPSQKKSRHRISFIGHSLGGLYNLSCLEFLSIATNGSFFDIFEPTNFVTLATPWLGIFEMGNLAKLACSWGFLKQTGKDLVLDYNNKIALDSVSSPENDFLESKLLQINNPPSITSASNPWHPKLILDPLYTISRYALSIIGLIDKDRDNLVRREQRSESEPITKLLQQPTSDQEPGHAELLQQLQNEISLTKELEYKLWSLSNSLDPIVFDSVIPEIDSTDFEAISGFDDLNDLNLEIYDYRNTKIPGGFGDHINMTANQNLMEIDGVDISKSSSDSNIHAHTSNTIDLDDGVGKGMGIDTGNKTKLNRVHSATPEQSQSQSQKQKQKQISQFSSSTARIRKVAQNWHTNISWRVIIVEFDFDAHNSIIVRREGSNHNGIFVIHHCLDNHDLD